MQTTPARHQDARPSRTPATPTLPSRARCAGEPEAARTTSAAKPPQSSKEHMTSAGMGSRNGGFADGAVAGEALTAGPTNHGHRPGATFRRPSPAACPARWTPNHRSGERESPKSTDPNGPERRTQHPISRLRGPDAAVFRAILRERRATVARARYVPGPSPRGPILKSHRSVPTGPKTRHPSRHHYRESLATFPSWDGPAAARIPAATPDWQHGRQRPAPPASAPWFRGEFPAGRGSGAHYLDSQFGLRPAQISAKRNERYLLSPPFRSFWRCPGHVFGGAVNPQPKYTYDHG